MVKKTNKAKLGILNFWENRAFDKISRNCAFYGNSINIHLLGDFCMQNNHICDENSTKSYSFHENAKIIENHWFMIIVWDFHWNSWADCHKIHKILFLDGKEDK